MSMTPDLFWSFVQIFWFAMLAHLAAVFLGCVLWRGRRSWTAAGMIYVLTWAAVFTVIST